MSASARTASPRRTWARPVAVALALAVLAAACGGGNGGEEATADPESCGLDALAAAEGPVTVQFWHAVPAENQQVLAELVDRFNSGQSEVQVEASFQGNYRDAFTKYRTALRSGSGLPDLVQLEETVVQQMIDSGSTVPVEACVEASGYSLDDYVPATVNYYTVEDVLRAMPWNVSNPLLFFNRSMLAAVGLDPDDPPATLDEVRAAAQAIVDAGVAPAGMALRVEPYVLEFMLAKAQALYVDNANGREARATASALEDAPAATEIFTWIKGMVDDGLAVSTGSQEGNLDHLFAIANGNAAMTFDSSPVLGPALNVLGSGNFPVTVEDFGVGPLPSVSTGGGVPVGDGALWLVAGDDPARTAAAWRFVEFLNEPENQAFLSVRTGWIPIRESATELPEVQEKWTAQPIFEVPYDQLLSGVQDAASSGSVIGDYQGVRDAVRSAWESMLNQGVDPSDAVARAAADATAAIEDYNSRVGS